MADVFKSYLFKNADYFGEKEILILHSSKLLPNKLIPFSKAFSTNNFEQWVCFYENDEKFFRVWNNPKKYLPILKKFYGVISPDFSVQRNMPLHKQIDSIFNGRILAHWWQQNGIEVIPNVRFNDPRTYEYVFNGIDKYSTIAVGSLGCIKNKEERKFFIEGFSEMVKILQPKNLIVYGSFPKKFFGSYKNVTNILHFPCWTNLIHSKKAVQ